MRKRIFLLPFLALALGLQAQSMGNSPYASFGIGEVKYDNSVETSAMGGINTAYIWDFNNSFNFKNPATNTNLEITSIKVQANNENQFFKTDYNNLNVTKHSSYLSNISIAFPISKKLKFGFGYQPYSSKKYNLVRSETLTDGTIKANRFYGEGTLNTVQAAFGYQINKEFALGLRSNFYFGKLADVEELALSDAVLINGYETSNKIKSFNFTLGTTYQKKFKNDRKLTLGATYTFGTTGNLTTNYINSSYYYTSDTKVNVTEIENKTSKDKNLIPTEFSFGVGYGKEAKWFASTQIDYKKGSTTLFLGKPFTYEDSYRISAGGWYLPNYNDFRNYLNRVVYRYGVFYEKGNLNINNTNINQYGITAGLTLPFQKSNAVRMSSVDLGLELGRKGTLKNNLIQQNFFNVKIGINFADKWFQKRVYE
jgi:hypothetical protein